MSTICLMCNLTLNAIRVRRSKVANTFLCKTFVRRLCFSPFDRVEANFKKMRKYLILHDVDDVDVDDVDVDDITVTDFPLTRWSSKRSKQRQQQQQQQQRRLQQQLLLLQEKFFTKQPSTINSFCEMIRWQSKTRSAANATKTIYFCIWVTLSKNSKHWLVYPVLPFCVTTTTTQRTTPTQITHWEI